MRRLRSFVGVSLSLALVVPNVPQLEQSVASPAASMKFPAIPSGSGLAHLVDRAWASNLERPPLTRANSGSVPPASPSEGPVSDPIPFIDSTTEVEQVPAFPDVSLPDPPEATSPPEAAPPTPVSEALVGFDPATSLEDPSARTEYSNEFDNADGTTSLAVSQTPVNYRLPDGSWAPIDAHFRAVADRPGEFVADQNSFVVTADAKGVAIRLEDGKTITLTVLGGAIGAVPLLSDDLTTVIYPEMWPGVDVRYRLSAVAVHKEIVLKGPGTKTAFDIRIGGLEVEEEADGGLAVVGDAVDDVTLGQVQMLDETGAPLVEAEPAGEVVRSGESAGRDWTIIAVEADQELLATLGPADWPVILDPDVVVGGTGEWSQAWARNSSGTQFTTCSAVGARCDKVRVGNASTSGLYRWRSVFWFDYSSALPRVEQPSSLVKAELTLTYDSGDWQTRTVRIRRAPEYSWCGAAGGTQSAGCVEAGTVVSAQIGTGSTVVPVTEIVREYWDTTRPIQGVAAFGFMSDEVSRVYSYKAMTARLWLTYSRPPSVSATIPADRSRFHVGAVTLAANGADSDVNAVLSYRFALRRDGQEVASSEWTASKTWQTAPLPVGWYQWTVEARDEYLVTSGVSPVREFVVTDDAVAAPSPDLVDASTPPSIGFSAANPFGAPITWSAELCEGSTRPCQALSPASGGQQGATAFATFRPQSLAAGRLYVLKVTTYGADRLSQALPTSTVRFSTASRSTVNPKLPAMIAGGLVGASSPELQVALTDGTTRFSGVAFCVLAGTTAPEDLQASGDPRCSASSGWMAASSTDEFATWRPSLQWNTSYLAVAWVRVSPTGTSLPSAAFTPFLTRLATEPRLRSMALDPATGVDAVSGNFSLDRVDAVVKSPSGMLEFHRVYNSALDLRGVTGAFGRGWTSLLDQRVVFDPARPGLFLYQADGSVEFHGKNADKTYSRPFGSVVDVVDVDSPGVTLPSSISYRVTDANETVFDFASDGALARIVTRDGQSVEFGRRDPVSFVQRILDVASGRYLDVRWSGPGADARPMSLSTPPIGGATLEWTYNYVGDRLDSVCTPLALDHCERYGYGTSQLLESIARPGTTTQRTTLTYDLSGRITSRTDPLGNTYRYGTESRTTIAVAGAATPSEFMYVSVTDPRQGTSQQVYDRIGRLVRTVDSAGLTRDFEYNGNGLLVRTTESSSAGTFTEQMTYDQDGNVVERRDRGGFVWTYTFDNTHRVTSKTSPGSASTTEFVYGTNSVKEIAPGTADQPASSSVGRVTETVRTDGSEPSFSGVGTMPKGLLRATKDPLGRVTIYDYDEKGDLRRVADPAGKVTEYAYDSIGRELTRVVRWTDGAGAPRTATWETSWTKLSQRASTTEPAVVNEAANPSSSHQRRTTWQYTLTGEIASVTDSDVAGSDPGRTTSFTYDANGRELTKTLPDGSVSTKAYDSVGNVIESTDALGRRFRTTYDARNLPVKVELINFTDPRTNDAPVTIVLRTTTYDGRGLVASEQDALGRTLVYTYDALGRMTATVLKDFVERDGTRRDLRLKEVVYDALGRAITEAFGNGATQVDRTFDARGRATAEVFRNTGSLTRRVTYSYDPIGSVTTKRVMCVEACTVPSLEERNDYDSAGRLIRRTVENGTNDLVTATRYDQLGNPVAVTDPRGTGDPARPAPEYTTVTAYDVLGRVSAITYPPVTTESKGVAPIAESPVVRTGYNTFGEVTDSVDANGNRTVTGYDSVGRRTSITSPQYTPPGGSALVAIERFAYDPVGNLTRRVDRLGQVWTFEFDSLNRAVRQVAPSASIGAAQATTLTWYDAVGNVVKTVDALGATTTCEYDALNRKRAVTEVLRPAGARTTTELAVTTLDYDVLGNLVYRRDPLGNVTTQIFSPLGELLRTTLPASGDQPSSSSYSYDLAGRVVAATDALGREQRMTFDQAGRATSMSLAAPAVAGGAVLGATTFSYDAAGNRLAVTRPEGDSTSFTYDGLNQLRTVSEMTGAAPSAWWRLGDTAVPAVQDSSGRAANGTAVGAVTLAQGTGALGSTDKWLTFSAGGRVDVPGGTLRGATKTISAWFKTATSGVVVARANGSPGSIPTRATPFIYVGTDGKLYAGADAANMLSTTAVVNNNTWQRAVLVLTPERQALYLNGTLVKTTARVASDDSWVTTGFIGTGFTAGFPASNGTWMPFVGAIDDVAVFDQPLGASRTGRAVGVQVALPPSATTSFGYDRAGNQTKTIDPKGMTWWTTYNSWNLVQSRVEPWTTSATEAEANRTFSYTYNAAGQLLSETLPGSVRTNNAYDNLGRLVRSAGVGAPGSRAFSYDLAGRLSAFSHPKGQVALQYDDRGQLVASSGPAGSSTFSYDLAGRMVSRTDAAGTASFDWTPRSELVTVSDPVTGSSIAYSYNSAQQPVSATVSTTAGQSSVRTFDYDPWGRLAADTTRSAAQAVLMSISYGYDRNGNLLQRTTGGPTVAAAGTERFSYDRANRLSWWSSATGAISEYGYDPNGNRTRAGNESATFDNRNRMKTQGAVTYNWSPRGTLSSTVTGGVTTSYTFSAFGEMLTVGGVSFTYDALGRIATRTSTGSAAADFSYAGVLSDPSSDGALLIARSPAGKPLSVGAGVNRGIVVANLHGDVVGTISDQGQVLSSRGFDPFGKVTASTGAVPSIGFQGDWTDPVSGLVDMGARWYSPVMGGFVSRDSYSGRLDTPVSLNRYTYANANPLAFADPTGRYSADSLAHYAEKARQSMASQKPRYASTPAQSAAGLKRGSLSGSADTMARQASIAAAAQAKTAQDKLISSQLRAMTVNQPTPKPEPAAPVAPLPRPGLAPSTAPSAGGGSRDDQACSPSKPVSIESCFPESSGSPAVPSSPRTSRAPSAEERALWSFVNYGDSFMLLEDGVNAAILCERGDAAACLDYGRANERSMSVLRWVDSTIRSAGDAFVAVTAIGALAYGGALFAGASCLATCTGVAGAATRAGQLIVDAVSGDPVGNSVGAGASRAIAGRVDDFATNTADACYRVCRRARRSRSASGPPAGSRQPT